MTTPIWSVYVIRCGDGSLYTGISTDAERRLAEHRSGRGAKYLRGRGPLDLVLVRRIGDRGAALREEQRIKRLDHAAKEVLLAGELARQERTAPAPPRSNRRR